MLQWVVPCAQLYNRDFRSKYKENRAKEILEIIMEENFQVSGIKASKMNFFLMNAQYRVVNFTPEQMIWKQKIVNKDKEAKMKVRQDGNFCLKP